MVYKFCSTSKDQLQVPVWLRCNFCGLNLEDIKKQLKIRRSVMIR